MRILSLLALLFVFVFGMSADYAHATEDASLCSHHSAEFSGTQNNDDCHSTQEHNDHEQSECGDCCCAHSHSIATMPVITTASTQNISQSISELRTNLSSVDLSGLRRPPRL